MKIDREDVILGVNFGVGCLLLISIGGMVFGGVKPSPLWTFGVYLLFGVISFFGGLIQRRFRPEYFIIGQTPVVMVVVLLMWGGFENRASMPPISEWIGLPIQLLLLILSNGLLTYLEPKSVRGGRNFSNGLASIWRRRVVLKFFKKVLAREIASDRLRVPFAFGREEMAGQRADN